MKIYIAGPMRGYKEFNFPAFHAAEDDLKKHGWECFNPARDDVETYGVDISKGNETGDQEQAEKEHGVTLRACLERDTAWICKEADAIFMLRGWQNSMGAKAEKALAEALGLEVYYEL